MGTLGMAHGGNKQQHHRSVVVVRLRSCLAHGDLSRHGKLSIVRPRAPNCSSCCRLCFATPLKSRPAVLLWSELLMTSKPGPSSIPTTRPLARTVVQSASITTPFQPFALLLRLSSSKGLHLFALAQEEELRVLGRGRTILEGDLWRSTCWRISSCRRLTLESSA